MISMDALFGLPRKKCAGTSYREPLHGMLFFEDQNGVDSFVEAAPKVKKSSNKVLAVLYCSGIVVLCILFQDCSGFLAGDALRSSTRYHALDETALFGCGCRHEFPLKFFNLKHGERCVLVRVLIVILFCMAGLCVKWLICRMCILMPNVLTLHLALGSFCLACV